MSASLVGSEMCIRDSTRDPRCMGGSAQTECSGIKAEESANASRAQRRLSREWRRAAASRRAGAYE
eukprot:10431819-Alexandrium_andersonii.AAC.1